MSNSVFIAYSNYYDLLYQDKDYSGEADYIQKLLSKFDISGGDLLEFGSGTGKHGRLLAKKGFNVHGIERSAEMVEQSEIIPGFTCQQGDICNINLERKFSAVFSLFHVVSYQLTNTQIKGVISSAASHLSSGGLFIFDFWYTPAVYSQKPSVRVKRISDKQVDITRIAEPTIHPNQNRVDVKYTLFISNLLNKNFQTIQETHIMRHYSLPEIDLLAGIYGFEIILAEEILTSKKPSEETWSVCVILRKQNCAR